MDGADVCRTSRRPPDVISTVAILDPRWRGRKWRHPGPGARFSIPIAEAEENGGPSASGRHLGGPHLRETEMRSSKMATGSGRAAIFLHLRNGDRKTRPILLATVMFSSSSVAPVCYLPKFSILASMFVWRFVCLLLAKIYSFGKYVRLLTAKFSILESMFVCRFVTCQNVFLILQVCSFDGLLLAKIYTLESMFVCVCDCVSVCLKLLRYRSQFLYIFTKLDLSMYICHVTIPVIFLGQSSNN